ncbi:AsmA family protein [Bradyrhizobium sp. ISRA443]|uniref:AsmA family protein n=1 Tax=unclassified Bradyrhizobium TaxID=2631580 RepID=UPI00247AA697|nr:MULTISPECIES: AsmA family protein [unclassified Bradyrhizobium]WGR94893.1 AsmA family protein [Bradyrhizobium sp. ISRA435]WGR99752.1 AsmA family protein [Bradyrhizobium sp. ISRA436]WGS06642.1 AsmA family protein [Bradyrhizobium sp. ISRA437]WGS13526.1 AsmA family protein [Bradyrhizobium sp. ISRA443]
MRALKFAGAAIAAAAVIIALLGAFGIPSGFLTSAIAERIERETGYKVAINGSGRIALWPTVYITLNDVVLQAPTRREVNNRFTADSIEAETTLSSLWSGRPEITDLVIIRPVVNLPLQRERTRDNNPPAQSASSGDAGTVSVRHVSISGGTIVLSNVHDHVEDRIETVNADVRVGTDRSIVVTGNARARDKPVKFEIRAAAPPLERQNAPTEFNIDAPGLLPAALKANAELRLNGTVLMFNGVSGTLGDGGFTGWTSVDFAGNKPLVKLDLDFRRISIATTPSQPGTASEPWSNAPIDFKLLNYVDAQARISAAELMIGDGRFAPAAIDASLASGVLKGRLSNLGAYDGNANGDLTIDTTTNNPTYALRLDLNGVRALPVLKNLAGFDKLDGRMEAKLDLHSQGGSERAIVAGLGGTALAAFQDGKIIGLNVAQMIRNLTASPLSGWQESAELSTDLSQLSASFKIDNGQAVTTDLDLVGPLVKMTGAGTVDLNTRQIGFRVEPQLVMTTEGQGRAGNPVGFGIPVMIEGPWANPRIYPEVQGIFDNPEAAYARLKEMGKGLFGPGGAGLGGLSDLLNGVQGGNGQPNNGGQAQGGESQNNPLGGQLGEAIGNLLQQGLSTLNQGNATRGNQGSTQGRSADPAPPPSPPDPDQRGDNPAMNDILRQLFNR